MTSVLQSIQVKGHQTPELHSNFANVVTSEDAPDLLVMHFVNKPISQKESLVYGDEVGVV